MTKVSSELQRRLIVVGLASRQVGFTLTGQCKHVPANLLVNWLSLRSHLVWWWCSSSSLLKG